MPKYNKVAYCKVCGASNNWSLHKKTSLLEKPEFCGSCGCNLATGKKAEKKEKKPKEAVEDVIISTNIPPLELDEESCYFPEVDSQSIGNLVAPVFKEEGEDSE